MARKKKLGDEGFVIENMNLMEIMDIVADANFEIEAGEQRHIVINNYRKKFGMDTQMVSIFKKTLEAFENDEIRFSA